MRKKVIKGHRYIIIRKQSRTKKDRDRHSLRAIGGKIQYSRGTPGAFGGRSKRRKNPLRGLVGSTPPYDRKKRRDHVASKKHVRFVENMILGKK